MNRVAVVVVVVERFDGRWWWWCFVVAMTPSDPILSVGITVPTLYGPFLLLLLLTCYCCYDDTETLMKHKRICFDKKKKSINQN